MIRTARVYEPPCDDGAARFLVDGLWPRGIRRADLGAEWVREVAPSAELRSRFHHAPEYWPEFVRRYHAELDERGEALAPILSAARVGDVVLLYAASDVEHNNAVALADYLERVLGGKGRERGPGRDGATR